MTKKTALQKTQLPAKPAAPKEVRYTPDNPDALLTDANLFSQENTALVRETLLKLEDDPHKGNIFSMVGGLVNIWSVLALLAKALEVDNYMEVGVRRGFSMAIVAARRPKANLTGFDMWIDGYGSAPNPGPDFVRAELHKTGFEGVASFINGDSAQTLKAFTPDKPFQLILVDGDHTAAGACRDVTRCLSFLAPGGYLVMDDLQDGEVMAAWDEVLAKSPGIQSWQRDRVGVIRRGN